MTDFLIASVIKYRACTLFWTRHHPHAPWRPIFPGTTYHLKCIQRSRRSSMWREIQKIRQFRTISCTGALTLCRFIMIGTHFFWTSWKEKVCTFTDVGLPSFEKSVNNSKLSYIPLPPPPPPSAMCNYQYLQQLAKVSQRWLIGKEEGRNESNGVFCFHFLETK